MCGGSSQSPEAVYKKVAVPSRPLPSLSMSSKDIIKRDGPSYPNVRTGSKRRSLFGPLLQASKNA